MNNKDDFVIKYQPKIIISKHEYYMGGWVPNTYENVTWIIDI